MSLRPVSCPGCTYSGQPHLETCEKSNIARITRFNQILDEASERCELKELVWKIYQDPKKVLKATIALKEILEGTSV